jgi:PAS domain S-box-containing protein
MRSSEETGRPEIDLGKIIEGMPAWVQVCGLDGTIQMVNYAATQISGYERSEMEGQTWPYPWFTNSGLSGHGEDSGLGCWPQAKLEESGHIPEFEAACTTAQSSVVILGVTLSLLRDEQNRPQYILMVAWDHTQRKVREIELRQAQRIQAVSQLASGIAHHINNNLAVILGYSGFLLSTTDCSGDVARQALSAIQEQSVDCANTVKRIQLFSRSVPKSHFSRFSLNDAVHDVIKATKPMWKYRAQKEGIDIRVETDLSVLRPVYGYRDGLQEALASLVSNSVEALSEGGVISIKTRDGGDEVALEVTDNGVGIAPVHINRIFDAFYTTKGPARSGLGLIIVYNLIVQQGGNISVSSQEGRGTTFVIRLPYGKGDAGEICGPD